MNDEEAQQGFEKALYDLMRDGLVEPIEGEDGKILWHATDKGRKKFEQSNAEDVQQQRLIREFEHYIRAIAQHNVDNNALTSLFEWSPEIADFILVRDQALRCEVLEEVEKRVIGKNPPKSKWWRYSGELLGHIQLRNGQYATLNQMKKGL